MYRALHNVANDKKSHDVGVNFEVPCHLRNTTSSDIQLGYIISDLCQLLSMSSKEMFILGLGKPVKYSMLSWSYFRGCEIKNPSMLGMYSHAQSRKHIIKKEITTSPLSSVVSRRDDSMWRKTCTTVWITAPMKHNRHGKSGLLALPEMWQILFVNTGQLNST